MGKGLSGTVFFFLGVLAFSFGVSAPAASEVSCPPVSSSEQQVSTPPSTYNPFYKKWLDANGIDIVGSDQVCDRTLQVAAEIVREMLIERPDIRENLITQHHFVAVFAVSEKMTDLPEDQDLKGIAIDPTRTYDTVCGGGGVMGRPTTVCERNLIGVNDPYLGRMSILVHEFGHTIQNLGVDQLTRDQIQVAYEAAQASHLFPRGDGAAVSYMMSNIMEYFAEGTTNWFNAADPTNPANSPEELGRAYVEGYDEALFSILARVYPDDSWIYPHN